MSTPEERQAVQRLLTASQQLYGSLIRSPLWEIVRQEPVITQWINALNQTEILFKEKENEPPQT